MKTIGMEIEDLIPHRDRMKLIGEIMDLDDQTAVTRSVVTPAWPTAGPAGVDPIVLIELAAQTVPSASAPGESAREEKRLPGVDRRHQKRRLSHDVVPLQAILHTRVRQLYGLESYSVFEGIVETGGDALARIQLQVFGEEQNGEAKKEP